MQAIGIFIDLPQQYKLLVLAVIAVMAVSRWKIYVKAGYKGWESIVPIYNRYVLSYMVFGTGWFFLAGYIFCILWIYAVLVNYSLGKVFQMGTFFCLGLVFLPFIFLPILAFTKLGCYLQPYSE